MDRNIITAAQQIIILCWNPSETIPEVMMLESSPFGFNNFSFTPTESLNSHGSNSASAVSFPVLIYEGSVNYWRTRETIYLSIYEHQKISAIAPHPEVSVCIEVVAYHPKIETEAPHIYLSSSLLYDKFLRNELEESKLREQNNSQSTKKTNIVKCNNKFTQECIRNYVLTRVGVLPATTTPLASSGTLDRSLAQSHSIELEDKGSFVFTIGFTPQLSDSDDGLVILKNKPPHLGELPVNSQARCVRLLFYQLKFIFCVHHFWYWNLCCIDSSNDFVKSSVI